MNFKTFSLFMVLGCVLASSYSLADSSSTSSSGGSSSSGTTKTSNVSKPEILYSQNFKWSESAPGIVDTWVFGANEEDGLYMFRVKMAPGAIIPPHTHPDERTTTVLGGVIYVGFSSKFDPAIAQPIPKGSAYVVPPNTAHFIWAKDGPAEYQEEGEGPTNTTLVKQHNHGSSSTSSTSGSSSGN